ncbi:MAG: isopentenyl-diphosphate Delta-isomerase [Thermaurantimonas sp.]|uniref:isopentenyl-diphosphate Delta-isomerase n=1 Tax=Thermaurantimonas sp. TaxID=2681568 RepID=UPI003918D893
MMTEHVILVDAHDRELGLMEKMEAHQKGLLHRAFSVFVLNDKKELLLQRRALDKYHSGGLWTNTCCSHPRKDEDVEAAAHRRLQEEMGFDCTLEKVLDFVYRADFSDGLTEHEFDHVFVGYFNGNPEINTKEVAEYKWMPLDEVKRDLQENPDNYTEWFKIIFDRFYSHVKD